MTMRPDDHRRKWDKKEYERKALDRIQKIKDDKLEQPEARELLKTREYKVDLDSKLGKSMVINKQAGSSSGGYFCNVCDCVVKDSINFLDHINGKKHQRNLGMSMKVERSTVDQVKDRFNKNKRKAEESSKKEDYDLQMQLKQAAQAEEDRKQQRKKKKKAHHEEDERGEDEDEMAKLMGFAGFGGAKKNH
jgi:U4/U6.U5 tri-snRNP component SNU23